MLVPIRNVLAIALCISTFFFTWKVGQIESHRREIKADAIELSHIKYGLFNVDEWKTIAVEIVERKVSEFEITPENRKEVIQKTEDLLETLIDEAEKFMREENSKSLGGFFRQIGQDLLVPFDKVREGIPKYAEQIVEKLNDPETKKDIKQYLGEKIDTFADETVGEMDYSIQNAILQKYGQPERGLCITHLKELLEKDKGQFRAFIIGLIASVISLLVLILSGSKSIVEQLSFTIASFILLVGGVALPMIDIEAAITQFRFLLIGEEVVFRDQVLFFQSKSILEVIGVLIENGDTALTLVAMLIFSFSVLMPLIKISLTAYAQIIGKVPDQAWIRFFIFRSAKWSMADVMVVALFMAYIGFSGVINSQLTQLERDSGSLEVFTTNNSTLQLGFYLFTAYALAGLLLGYSFRKEQKERNT